MNKIFCSIILLCIFSVVPPAMAGMTVSGWGFVADAQVDSSFGADSDHNEGVGPVSAYAEVLVGQEGAAAMAVADWLSVNGWSALAFQSGNQGGATSYAGEAVFGISSTTPWQLDLESVYLIVPSENGSVALSSQAWVFDGTGTTELYSYDLAIDGPIDTEVFGAGLYELRLYVTSAAVLLPPLNFEAISSSVKLKAIVTPIPVPGSALLVFFGVGLIHRLRRVRII